MLSPSRNRRGFTLIELLVVIAIIGILAAVVIASLAAARTRGNDAAVKENLVNSRAQGELFYLSNGNSYTNGTAASNVCDPAGLVLNTNGIPAARARLLAGVPVPLPVAGTVKGVNTFVSAAASVVGIPSVTQGAIGTASNAVCNSSATAWAAQVPLQGGGFYCVDSTGQGITSAISVITTATDYSCS
ncbi:MAG: hypothetical protein JWO84_643 [Parcubacteria group bacterium]|nr:hypothetical protein [Parcubacteria group bacterium]